MKKRVTIIDYGIGNILSVSRALQYWDVETVLCSQPEDIESSDYVVLPGVGAFADGMKELERRGLVEAIQNFCKKGNPFLGICLGMQMMMDHSEEFGMHKGLSLISGNVKAIPKESANGTKHKIPHIGWNQLVLPKHLNSWNATLMDEIPNKTCAYFVHSFTAIPDHEKHRLADCYYNGHLISAAICRENMYGTQFHPEKSGPIGLKMVRNFLSLKSES